MLLNASRFAFLSIAWASGCSSEEPDLEIGAQQQTDLLRYIENEAVAANDYVTAAFGTRDVVLLGETHFIR